MNAEDLKGRTKSFALRVVKLCSSLPRNPVCDVLGKQLLRAGTSVGANYRSACRARSKVDFVAKMAIVEEEADECTYWLELLVESKQMKAAQLAPLLKEANELTAIASASRITARRTARSTRRKVASTDQSNRHSTIETR